MVIDYLIELPIGSGRITLCALESKPWTDISLRGATQALHKIGR
jgi:hypothetical protein